MPIPGLLDQLCRRWHFVENDAPIRMDAREGIPREAFGEQWRMAAVQVMLVRLERVRLLKSKG